MSMYINILALCLVLLFSSFSVQAGNGSGKVTQLMPHAGDVVFFSLGGEHANPPKCSSTAWSISLSTHTGRAMYALLLSAHTQGLRVQVQGTGDCSAWPDRETAHYILSEL